MAFNVPLNDRLAAAAPDSAEAATLWRHYLVVWTAMETTSAPSGALAAAAGIHRGPALGASVGAVRPPSFAIDGQLGERTMAWSNQVAVVTGGARGLGRAAALLLARRGAAVLRELRRARRRGRGSGARDHGRRRPRDRGRRRRRRRGPPSRRWSRARRARSGR